MSIAEKPSSLRLMFEEAMRVIREDGYVFFVWFLVWKILWKLPALQSLVIWRFAVATKNILTVEDALEFAFSKRFGALIYPLQICTEIKALCDTVRQRRPRTVLEIGTEKGGTLFLFSRAAADDALLVSVDLPAKKKRWRSLCPHLGRNGQNVFAIDGDSHANSTVERVCRFLGGRKVDFLFIDGDHSYEGVRQDFENYVGFLNEPGIIAFHDINPNSVSPYWRRFGNPTSAPGEVYRFWGEMRMKYPYAEFMDQNGYGIGVLFVGANAGKTLIGSH